MGEVFDIYEIKKKKLREKHTKNGKLTNQGMRELFKLASQYGKTREEYLPSDYGTDEWENRD